MRFSPVIIRVAARGSARRFSVVAAICARFYLDALFSMRALVQLRVIYVIIRRCRRTDATCRPVRVSGRFAVSSLTLGSLSSSRHDTVNVFVKHEAAGSHYREELESVPGVPSAIDTDEDILSRY